MKRDIAGIVTNIVNKYQTRDPEEIAAEMGIKVTFEDLGRVNGYYNTSLGNKYIHINHRLKMNDKKRKLTIAHELGHVILHDDLNARFMAEHTYFSINKYENEANKFAVHLLIPDNELLEYQREGYTTQQIANCYHLPQEFINLRIYGTMDC